MCPHPPPAARRHQTRAPQPSHRARPYATGSARPQRTGRCPACGHRVESYPRTDHRLLALHPAEFTLTTVPTAFRWHLSSGIAHPRSDGTNWCRIPHTVLCPSTPSGTPLTAHLNEVRRQLAVRTRILIDTGLFTPAPASPLCPALASPGHPAAGASGAPRC